jgi:glucose-6-phosphate 1-epimerase
MDKIELRSIDGAQATMLKHGAHVTSWVTPDGSERLFLSPRAEFAPGKAIRGGVPIIFPQFNQRGPLPRHGFARTAQWDAVEFADGSVTMRMAVTDDMRAIWPHDYTADFTAQIDGNSLMLTLAITNTGNDTFAFTAALHTYLLVNDVRKVRIDGLSGLTCEDSIAGKTYLEDADMIIITQETDRIYNDAIGSLVVAEPGRTLWLKQTGFRDVVVWNPWTTAEKMRDMEPDGYLRMVCVEAAVIGEPVVLKSGESWRGTQQLRAG